MTPYAKLSYEERDMFDNYFLNATGGYEDLSRLAPNKERLAVWNQNKERIFKVFGEQLILRKPIVLKKGTESWQEQFECLYRHQFFACLSYHYFSLGDSIQIKKIFPVEDFISNKLSKDIILYPKHFPIEEIGFKKGMKTMRVLSKLAEKTHLQYDYEDFRIFHSTLLQEKNLIGQLCLSIHPLDFLTMSDNGYKWSSCMSIKKQGDYCAGVVEMMNSPCVVCVYLEGNKPFYINKEYEWKWTNKKWRCLFVVTPDYIIPIKDYPYQSPVLETIAIKWLAELMEQNNSDHPKYHSELLLSKKESFGCKYFLSENKQVELILQTNVMYNDTGTKQVYYLVNQDIYKQQEPEKKFINYSGPLTCLWCGDLEGDSTDKPQFLSCVNCRKDWYCCICDKKLEKDEALLYQHHLYICEECLQDCHFTLDNNNSLRSYRDSIQIIVIPNIDILDKVNLPCDKDFVLDYMRKTKFLHHYIDLNHFVSLDVASWNKGITDYLNKTFPQYFQLNEEQVKQPSISSFYSTGIGINENLYTAFSTVVFIDEKGLTPEGKVKFAEMVSSTDQQDLASAEDYIKELESEISANSTIISRRTQI